MADLGATNREGTDGNAFPDEGDPNQCVHAGLERGFRERIAGAIEFVLGHIDLEQVLAPHHPLQHRIGAALAMFAQERHEIGRKAARGGHTAALALEGPQNAPDTATKADRLLQHCIEHRGQVAGRAVDDTQDVSGCGLLFQGFARLAQQPRVLHRDHRLLGEIL